jgi:hypothetical protein
VVGTDLGVRTAGRFCSFASTAVAIAWVDRQTRSADATVQSHSAVNTANQRPICFGWVSVGLGYWLVFEAALEVADQAGVLDQSDSLFSSWSHADRLDRWSVVVLSAWQNQLVELGSTQARVRALAACSWQSDELGVNAILIFSDHSSEDW